MSPNYSAQPMKGLMISLQVLEGLHLPGSCAQFLLAKPRNVSSLSSQKSENKSDFSTGYN